eukprot:CAMPEP_0175006020 /NCGR_PEP_ID=MMETSP0005-20121125/5631_1 /TAXON_ID=420556 /ORGANISM="Ochromonas sp., Strain CCMP1393" /LENGTH=591 /DNA_ID=CAMNT_0016261319 /DNA_START=427 /DNA_END=2199 /DNA_ORIENTATION=+
MGGQPTAQEAVGQALCVEEKNSEVKEDFFDNADVVDSDVFSTSDGQKTYSYAEEDEIVLTVDANYDQNDSVAAFFNSPTSGFVSNGPGFLQMPQPDFTGACNDQNYITFENRVELQTCHRELSIASNTFAAQCSEQFSMKRFVTDLYVASAASVVASTGVATIADTISITLNSVNFDDYDTHSVTDVTTAWNANDCNTTAYYGSPTLTDAGTTISSSCTFSDANTLGNLTSSSSGLCTGFVKNVHYTVNHATTTAAAITSITADVVITDVPMTTSTGTAVTVEQCFSVEFDSADATLQTSDNGNLVERYRSGNPGYLMGKPVLYGSLSGTVIESLVDGMTVPTALLSYDGSNPVDYGKSVCPQSTAVATDNAQSVKFGYDLLSGCTVQLTREELLHMCCAGAGAACSDVAGVAYSSPYSDASTGIPYMLNFVQRYVGNYGDASPLDTTKWTQIDYSVPSDTRTWSDATATCANMFSGLDIEFLVAFQGSRSNPQNKIISSKAAITTTDWVMNVPVDDMVSTQSFPVTVTVSFVFQDENDIRGYVAPAPPVLFKVPYDVFAPFVNAGPSQYGSGRLVLGIALCLSGVSTLWL